MGTPCRAFLVTSAFVWLSGCAVGPDYEPPAVAVPKVFGTASPAPTVAGAPATADFVRWWDALRDPQLNWLIERAVAGNPDIEIALLRVQEARSQEIVVLGAMLPTVDGRAGAAAGSGGDLMRSRTGLILRSGDSVRGFRAISRMAGFDSAWELDLFGKVQRSLEAARDDAEAQMELRNAALITVIADVARNYLEIRTLQMRLEIAREDVAAAARAADWAPAKLQRGPSNESESKQESKSPSRASKSSASDKSDAMPVKPSEPEEEAKSLRRDAKSSEQENKSSKQEDKALSNELSLTLARADLATRQAKLPELEAAISAAASRLAMLVGTYEADVAAAIRGPAKLPLLPERLHPGVPVDLLRRRPDLRSVERELAAATARIGVATADLFPSVTLTSGFGGQGTTGRTSSAPVIRGPIWSVGPGVNWPLLDFGRLDALINIEEMRTREVLVRYKKTILAAVEEVDQAVEQYRLELQRWKSLRAAVEAMRQVVSLTTERHRRGDTDLRDLLHMQRRMYALEELAAIAAEAAALRYVAFCKALGGGWELYNELPPMPAAQPALIATVRRLTDGWH
jgi:outer membrane protein TolC